MTKTNKLLAKWISVGGTMLIASFWVAAAESPWELENKEVWRFPDSMKVADIKKEFGAKGDGKTDDTAALQQALDRPAAFIYLPNGTYLVRERLLFSKGPTVLPAIQGETRDGVVIKLADDAVGFDDPEQPKPVIQLVRGEQKDRLSADYFKTKVRNLTIDAGKHKGAIGLIFYANNNGMLRNVRIIGQGAIGLHLERQLNGPLLVSNVEIEGFAVGLKAGSGPFNSQTVEHLILKDQTKYGIENEDECLSIRGVFSRNSVPAVCSRAGNMVLIDSELTGGDARNPAIICGSGQTFVRNVKTSGYGQAIARHHHERKGPLGEVEETVGAGTVAEWSSFRGTSNFAPAGSVTSLNLPIEEAPYEPLDKNFSNWVCVDDFGAVPNDKQDDTEAVRRAIAFAMKNNKSTLCFGHGEYLLDGRIPIGGSIRRVQGANTFLRPVAVDRELNFVVEEGDAPVVLFDLMERVLGPKYLIKIENASARTLVVRNFRGILVASGPGKTFSEDAVAKIFITNPKARVWARQLNSEGRVAVPGLPTDVKNENKGGTLWVLGIKTEGYDSILRTVDGGRSEVLGGWIYVISGKQAPTNPMFITKDAVTSLAGIIQFHFMGLVYKVLVDETQGGVHKELTKATNDGRGSITLFRSK